MRARSLGILSAFAAVVVAFVLSVPISGIYGVEEKAEILAVPTTLKIGFMQDIDSLNPYIGLNDASYVFYSLVYDALTCVDDKMNVTGNLALSTWTVPTADPKMVLSGEPYGSVWQYNLTHNAYWHDGEPFTADDVVWNMKANSENYTTMWAYQPYTYFMNWTEKVDDYTVRIHFYDRDTGEPMPAAYPYSLSMYMLPEHLLSTFPAQNLSFTWPGYFDNIAPAPPVVGTGPFMVTQSVYEDWLAGDPLTLVKNPNYHWTADHGKSVQFDRLQMLFYEESTAMLLALEAGQIDVAQLPPQTYRSLESDVQSGDLTNIELFNGPKMTQYWTEITFCMNNAGPNPARLDRTIRQALSMATNKSYITAQYYLGFAEPGTTIIPPVNSFWHYEPSASEKAQMAYNLTAAAQLLEENGYRYANPGDTVRVATADSYAVKSGLVANGTPLTFEMIVRREYPEEKNIAAFLKDQWAQIGVTLNYMIVDEAELSARVYLYSYDTAIWYWSSDVDPNYMLFCKAKESWSGWNDNMWNNASYEQNYTNSVRAMDPYERQVYVDNCQRIEFLDADYILLAYPNQTYAWRDDTFSGWGDWAPNPGRSIDNYYTANPLWFDLVSLANKPPVASFTVVPTTGPISTDFVVNASSSSDPEDPLSALVVRWDWEHDGTWDTAWSADKVANHSYDTNGTFVIALEVKDTGGLTDTELKSVIVTNAAPTASFTISPTSGRPGNTFELNASSSSDPEDSLSELQVRWDWNGDGAWDTVWSTQKVVNHKYDDAGTYNVGLQVMDSGGLTNTTHRTLVVEKSSTMMWIAIGVGVIAVAAGGLAFYFLKRRPY
jgi:peptide/nickel transport system substrate-binding protein